jgi:hypothetical protein
MRAREGYVVRDERRKQYYARAPTTARYHESGIHACDYGTIPKAPNLVMCESQETQTILLAAPILRLQLIESAIAVTLQDSFPVSKRLCGLR